MVNLLYLCTAKLQKKPQICNLSALLQWCISTVWLIAQRGAPRSMVPRHFVDGDPLMIWQRDKRHEEVA